MVGFNRRFAPLARRLREALGGRGALLIGCRVNAGALPASHWTHDPQIGGGRLVGEACHYVDLAAFLAGGPPTTVFATTAAAQGVPREDATAATLAFPDGSVAQIVYSALGDPSLPKERVEVLGEHGAGVLDDFRELVLHRHGREETVKGRRDKGHAAELEAFLAACRSGEQPWPVADMAAVMRATFALRAQAQAPPG
jgi:predicted dehydrogenase